MSEFHINRCFMVGNTRSIKTIRGNCVVMLKHALSTLRPQAGPSSGPKEKKKYLDVVIDDDLPDWIAKIGESDGGGDFPGKKPEENETAQTDVDTEKDSRCANGESGDTKVIKRKLRRRKYEWDQSKKRWAPHRYTSRNELLECAKTTFDLIIDDDTKSDDKLSSIITDLVKLDASRPSFLNDESDLLSTNAEKLTSRSWNIPSSCPYLYLEPTVCPVSVIPTINLAGD